MKKALRAVDGDMWQLSPQPQALLHLPSSRVPETRVSSNPSPQRWQTKGLRREGTQPGPIAASSDSPGPLLAQDSASLHSPYPFSHQPRRTHQPGATPRREGRRLVPKDPGRLWTHASC